MGEQTANYTLAEVCGNLHDRYKAPLGFRNRPDRQMLGTGVASVDGLLGGGFPKGTLCEICGPSSSNRTALAVAMLARALDAGECCAWIDASGTFDPESAEEAGVRLDRLLWINCRGDAERSLRATDLLLHGGGFGVMVFDLADIPEVSIRRIEMAAWFRLRHAAEETGTTLIAITPTPQTRSCSSVCLEVARQKSLWRGKLLRGIAAAVQRRKHIVAEAAGFEMVL